MNTIMFFDYLKNERREKALYSEQGLDFAYTFLREREQISLKSE